MQFQLKFKKGGFMNNFFNSINWMLILRCFIVGGLFCVTGQILIDKTKLTPARILVIYVTLGVLLRRYWNIQIYS